MTFEYSTVNIMEKSIVEEWRAIDRDPRFEVSNLGNIRRIGSCKNLRLYVTHKGYLQVSVRCKCHKCGSHSFRVHREVAIAFLGPSDLQVNHKNGDKKNNCVYNLEYMTNRENQQHAYATGVSRRSLTPSQVIDIRERLSIGESFLELAVEFGVGRTNISNIASRRTWDHLNDGYGIIVGRRGARIGNKNGLKNKSSSIPVC